jgi:ribosomal protein S18 acetylase RimI-like enzyme
MRPGDLGVIAETERNEPIGAAWVRLLKAHDPGYGYVDDETPELAIGVYPSYRGSGVGTAMLARLIDMAKEHYPAVSLSTRATNVPAVRLYERMGFKKVAGSEVTNWAGGMSYNMKVDFVGGTQGNRYTGK